MTERLPAREIGNVLPDGLHLVDLGGDVFDCAGREANHGYQRKCGTGDHFHWIAHSIRAMGYTDTQHGRRSDGG